MAGTNLPRVPEGLRDLMKAYTKEVLREKPTNLYVFSSDYFERIAGGRVHHKVLKYEPPQSYEIIMKNRIRQQVPISLVFNIIPDNLTELIKKFIKAVLREKPENLLIFAVDYFQRLRSTHSPRMEYTKYSAYEKYSEEKGSSFAPQEKCSCGRILSSKTRELEIATKEGQNEAEQKHEVSTESTHSVQYLKAVCIIQKQIRKYLKEKRERVKKDNSVSSEIYKNQDYMNAIFLIQRQFRRYLSKKRAAKAIELKKENRYDSVEYMNAIRVIQRYCRQYLRKRAPKRQLNVNKTPATERKLSVTTAAFIIQRAFRNMVKTRRAKRHVNAELDQGDELNDNASEAASYTSASTALLSTESTYEHIELGGSNYDEGVHQQTIQEDEEVENDNTNNPQGEFITKDTKSKGKSIHSDGNALHKEMDNRKKRGLYGQKSRRDIHSEPNYDKPITSSENSEDFPSETENIKNNILNVDSMSSLAEQADDKKAIEEEESITKSVFHLDSMETSATSHTQDPEDLSLTKEISVSDNLINANQLKNIEESIINVNAEVEDTNESNTEKSIKASISKADSSEADVQSNELERAPSSENPGLHNKIENSEEPIIRSNSQMENIGIASQSDELASLTNSQKPSEEILINAELLKISQRDENVGNEVLQAFNQAVLSEGAYNNKSTNVDLEQSSTSSIIIEDKPTCTEENPLSSTDNNKDTQELTTENTDKSDRLNTENDYSIEVNSLQTLLGTMKEKINQDEAISDIEKSTTLSPTDQGSLELQTVSTPKVESVSTAETKDPEIAAVANLTPKVKSADSTLESEEPKRNVTNSEAENAKESAPINNDIGKSIIIHSVIPGEDDYEISIPSDGPLSLDYTSNATESVPDITKNTEENKNIEKNNIDEHELKQDSHAMPEIQKFDKLEENKTTKENTQNIDDFSTELDSSSKPTEVADVNENIKHQQAKGDLDANDLSNANKMIDKQSAENIDKIEEQLETELKNPESQIAIPSGGESIESVIKEIVGDSEIMQSSTSTIEDINTENTNNLYNVSSLTENVETISAENSDNVNKKSISEVKVLTDSDPELKTPVENLKGEVEIVNETINKTLNRSFVESVENTNESPILAQQDSRKNEELEVDIINTTSDGDSKQTIDEQTHDETLVTLPLLAEEETQDKIKRSLPEKTEDDTVILPLSNENQDKSEDNNNTNLSEEAQEKPLTSSSEDRNHDYIKTLSGKADENPMIALNDEKIQNDAVEKEDDLSRAPLSEGNEKKLKNDVQTSVSEESQDKITENKSNLVAETEEKLLTSSHDDKIKKNLESTFLEETEKTSIIASSDETNEENIKVGTGKIDKDNIQTTSSEQETVLDGDKFKGSLQSSLSKETEDKDNIQATSSEGDPILEEDIPKLSLQSSLSKETGDKDNIQTTSSEGDPILEEDIPKLSLQSSLSKETGDKDNIQTTSSEGDPILEEDISKLSLQSSLSKETGDKDNIQTTSSEGDPVLEEDIPKGSLQSSLSKETGDKDNIQTTSSEGDPILEEDIPKLSLQSSLSKETGDKDNIQTTSSEGDPILEEDIPKLSLQSSLSKETGDKDNIQTTSSEGDPVLEEDIPKGSLQSSLSKKSEDKDNIQTTSKGSPESSLSKATDDKDKDNINIPLSEGSAERSASTDNDDTDLTGNTLILNNTKTISAELSNPKSFDKDGKEEISTKVEPVPDKDFVDSVDVSKSKPIETHPSIAEVSNLRAENNKYNEVKPDSQISENKSSLLLSNQLVDTQIKKVPIVKDKQLTSFTSSRLTNAPVAELQLKSFKTDSDGGNWYDVYTEPNENSQTDNARLEKHQLVEMPERRPNYVYGEESATQETIKPKQSIAFFISFDGDDGKTSFKIPKRFLRQSESSRETSKSQVLTMDPIILSDESDVDIGYQQFGAQKLQTIHELNENESSTELKSLMDKSEDNVKEFDDQNISIVEKINAETIEGVDLSGDKVKNLLNVNEDENKIVNDNESHQSHDFKRKRSAQIIQRAYKNYKTRREIKHSTNNKDNDDKKDNKLDENAAATRIQKAIRYFLARIQNTKDTASLENRKYSNAEILAAIRIQNMFRNYVRRKKEAYNEDLSKGTSATSLITIIPNTNDSQTPEVSLNEGELSEDTTMMNPEGNSTKPEWFVGTQRISLESSRGPMNSSETDIIGITESTDNIQIESDTKLTTDIGNIVNELNASEVFAQDNGASNNLAGSANETLEDLAIEAFGELDASLKDTSARQLLNAFLSSEIEFSSIQKPYPVGQDNTMLEEVLEEKCIKKSVSLSNLFEEDNEDKTEVEKEDTQLDAMDEVTSKLMKPDEVIEKMSQRRSTEKLKEDFQITEPSFDEPIIRSMSSLQEQNSLDIEDGDIIVYNRLQRDETRESSAQSESVVFGNDNDDEKVLSIDTTETARSQLSRHYTIAGEDPRVIFRSVTIDETVRYIENRQENENEDEDHGVNNSMSFCLDDETSENIRKKMMAYSLSEGDSDYFDPSKIVQDDFHIDTAMTDAMDTSTETESTIVSAATKIQAGARGFLARRRLRRASAGTKSSTQETKASFGNDAISESLERFIEEEAAKKIQVAYRLHSRKQKKQTNNLKSASLESSLAAKRQTLQRGDALRNDSNSTPEDENSSGTSAGQPPKAVDTKSGKDNVSRSKRSSEYGLKWPTVRQNSMPVQIDCEVLRPLPKHMRRRIKSAENGKKKNRK